MFLIYSPTNPNKPRIFLENTDLINIHSGVRTPLSYQEFWESDVPRWAKNKFLYELKIQVGISSFAILTAPLFGGDVEIEGDMVFIHFGGVVIVIEPNGNCYIPNEDLPYSYHAVQACDYLELLY